MSYNINELSFTQTTTGKITVLTALVGIFVFSAAFFLNLGAQELHRAGAQGFATTTLTVLNTPPDWAGATLSAEESTESSTTTPTNSGDVITWLATANDPSDQPYFLIICDGATPPLAQQAADYGSLGTAPPVCDSPAAQIAVSTSTVDETEAFAATTTLESFAESNDWYAWVCDDDPIQPECSTTFTQGTSNTASPFNVNHRPVAINVTNDGPTLPGAFITITASSTDPDVVDTPDQMQLFVCSSNSFDFVGQTCTATEVASSSLAASFPSVNFQLSSPLPDDAYTYYPFIVDEHGHGAGTQLGASTYDVANATPTVQASSIILNGGGDITLSVDAGETTGLTLDFMISDLNSCENSVGAPTEISGFNASVFRTGVGTTTCNTSSASYDPNNCYGSQLAPAVWNLSCTASSSSCTGPTDVDILYECTFPLWYVADPTDNAAVPSFFETDTWSAAVRGIDDDFATGTLVATDSPVELFQLATFSLDDLWIAYGQLAPGDRNETLTASTTFTATGNVGIDQSLLGQAMCNGFTSGSPCAVPYASTSTIPENFQVFSTTSAASYGSASSTGNFLSSTTPVTLDLNVLKPTSTSTQTSKETYWGIEVPDSITFSGSYTGENTFNIVVSDAADWY